MYREDYDTQEQAQDNADLRNKMAYGNAKISAVYRQKDGTFYYVHIDDIRYLGALIPMWCDLVSVHEPGKDWRDKSMTFKEQMADLDVYLEDHPDAQSL